LFLNNAPVLFCDGNRSPLVGGDGNRSPLVGGDGNRPVASFPKGKGELLL